MLILAIILICAGAGSCIYGNYLNNNVEAQLESILGNGTANPGTMWMIIGAVVAVVGLVLLIMAIMKRNKDTD